MLEILHYRIVSEHALFDTTVFGQVPVITVKQSNEKLKVWSRDLVTLLDTLVSYSSSYENRIHIILSYFHLE